jgi:hypothetical protein
MTTSSMTPEQLLENFKTQQQTAGENIRQLETELAKQKELFVKLQGAIEGMLILSPEEEPEQEVTTSDAEVVNEVLS